MSSSRKFAGRLFQTRGLATAKLLSPNVLCVRGTARDLSVDERSRRRGPSETKCMSSARYEGAWPDNDEKTKHASLKSTRRWTGSQCNWRNTDSELQAVNILQVIEAPKAIGSLDPAPSNFVDFPRQISMASKSLRRCRTFSAPPSLHLMSSFSTQ